MLRWAHLLGTIGVVRGFDYPYMAEGRKRPDPLPKLINAHRSALQDCAIRAQGQSFSLAKAWDRELAVTFVAGGLSALVCLGYPLCGGGDPTKLRDQVLREIRTPILFVQGTRDPLCPLSLLDKVRSEMCAPNEVHVVTAATTHFASPSANSSEQPNPGDVNQRILQRIQSFVETNLPRAGIE